MTDGVKSDTWNIVGGYTSMSYSHLEQEGKVYQIAFQMSRRGGGGRGGRQERKKDVWDVEGGYMGMKKQKLEEQFKEQVCSTLTHNSPGNNSEFEVGPFQANLENQEGGIFAGVSIFVNGRTDPSAEELKRLMMTHGGTYHHYMSSRLNLNSNCWNQKFTIF